MSTSMNASVLFLEKAIKSVWSISMLVQNPFTTILVFKARSQQGTFVSLAKPHARLGISGIESRLRKIGRNCKISRVHPHKFRRTLATMAIDKGMPVEQVQQLLGHVKIDTTMHYAMVNQNNVKLSHRKYIG